MVWHRLPSFLPNFTLKLLPLSEAQQKAFEATGFVRNVAFRTAPSASKVRSACVQLTVPLGPHCSVTQPMCRCYVQPEIKQILERLYGLRVKSVRTLNVEGKKKRGKHSYYRGADYKKAYVTLEPPTSGASQ